MGEDIFPAPNVERRRLPFGDVTNLPPKRGLSSVLGCGTESEDGDSRFAKQICLGVHNLVSEVCNSKSGDPKKDDEEPSLIKYGPASPSSHSNASTDADENEELAGDVALVKVQRVGDAGEVSRDSCASSGSMPTSYLPCKKHQVEAGASVSTLMGGNKLFELTRCTAYQGDACANVNSGADLLEACSCSFCIKAAYIWSDLHYQDIKGRINALKKSQKEASILLNKYDTGKLTNNSSKLEPNLTGLWKSLFHHMEDIFVQESSQLQSSFVTLRELRDDCKVDLERITGMPSDGY